VTVQRDDEGERLGNLAAHVVVATGPGAESVVPNWPAVASFPGMLIHAGSSATPARWPAGMSWSSAPGTPAWTCSIIWRAAALWLSARSGMHITPLRLADVPLHPVSLAGRRLPRRVQDASLRVVKGLAFGDLARYGHRLSELGAFTRIASRRDHARPDRQDPGCDRRPQPEPGQLDLAKDVATEECRRSGATSSGPRGLRLRLVLAGDKGAALAAN